MQRSTSSRTLSRNLSGISERKQSLSNLRNRISTVSIHDADERIASSTSSKGNRLRKKDMIEKFIESPQPLVDTSLSQLRHTILCEGLPDPCPYRSYIWSILLRAAPIESEWYSGVVARGEINADTIGSDSKYSKVGEKIRNDAFRTFQSNEKFWAKASKEEFVRILNAFAWCVVEGKEMDKVNLEESDLTDVSPYVQGMNVLLAPFLYVGRSEPQAFALFYNLMMIQMPRYVTPTIHGTMDGVKLVEIVLKSVDPKLAEHLARTRTTATLYALPSVLTLCACTPSLDELLKLWDFLFSFGVHMNIILIVSQLLLIRTELLNAKNPMSLLRQFPELNADKIIKLSLSITKSISDELNDLIVRHLFDDSVTELIDNYKL